MLRIPAIVALAAALCFAQPADLERARAAYQRTDYDVALRALGDTDSPEALLLAGKAHYGKGDFKEASETLQRAAEAAPSNAEIWNWLGKANGRRAETSSFISAPKWASRCRQAFEKAVELAPRNVAYIDDLFSYYLDAPGFLGGGVDKAEQFAARLEQMDKPQWHYARAGVARKRDQFDAAERECRKAVELDPDAPWRLVELARFLASRGRHDEADALLDKAMASGKPSILFDTAAIWLEHDRRQKEARDLLEKYLTLNLTPDDPPRREAQELLRR